VARRLIAPLVVVVALAACGGNSDRAAVPEPGTSAAAQPAAAQGQDFRIVKVASGLESPVHLTFAPGEPRRLYVVEQAGRIRVIDRGRLRAAPFLDIHSLVRSGGEQGLLSVAFHPKYRSNHLFYVNYTDVNGDSRIVEYRSSASGAPRRTRELFFLEDPYPNHNGGQLAFDEEGFLYFGMGDGGAAGDPENRAQDLSNRFGKLLRLDVDNPGADWQIAAYGLRNPWRFSFDRKTDDLYIGDVGQGQWEEIDFTTSPGTGLENFGWDVFEGTHEFEDKSPNDRGELVGPIYEYSHDDGSCSVTGGFVYRGSKIPAARGRYFFGDYCSNKVWSLVVRGGQATDVRLHDFTVPGLSSFGEGPSGELYLVAHGGTIYRLAPGGS
jgi:glucose/arabinose dehydrogenase